MLGIMDHKACVAWLGCREEKANEDDLVAMGSAAYQARWGSRENQDQSVCRVCQEKKVTKATLDIPERRLALRKLLL